MKFTLTQCVNYINVKIAGAIASGENHRTHPEAKNRVYKCTIRRDFAECINQHLTVAMFSEEEYERQLNVLRGRIRDLQEQLEKETQ